MKNLIFISVKETPQELEQARKQCATEVVKRVDMLIALKKHPNISKLQLSGEINMSLNSIRKWFKRYNEGGLARLLQITPHNTGRRSATITPEIYTAIEQWLNNPTSSRFTDLYNWINKTYAPDIKLNSFRKYVAKHLSKQLEGIKLLCADIKESFDELEALHEKCSPFMRTRIKMLILLKKENGISPSNLSRKAGIAYNSAIKWHKLYKQGGLEKLLEVKRGKGRWDKHSVFNFPQEVFDAIEKHHTKTPFTNYMELFRWTTENYLPEIKYPQLLKHLHTYFGDKLNIDKSVKLNVTQTVEELEDIYANSPSRIKLRIKMLIVLKKEQKLSLADIAKHVGVTYGSVVKWCAIYKNDGLIDLVGSNRSSIINNDTHYIIKQKLAKGEFKNFSSLFNWVKENQAAEINYNTFHRYIHRNFKLEVDRMKMILKVPVKESLESLLVKNRMNPAAIKVRMDMLIALKKNPFIKMSALSNILHASNASIKKWCALYTSGGIEKLVKVGQRGRKKFIMPRQIHTSIEKYIGKNPDKSIKELYDHIRPVYREALSYNKLYRYVRTNINKAALKKEMKKRAA